MDVNPNIFAWLSLILCFPVSMVIMSLWRPQVAVPVIILGGQMFLPPAIAFEFKGLPSLGKDVLPPLCALLSCLILRPKSLANSRPGRGLDLFIVARIIGAFGSSLTNRDPMFFPRGFVPGLSLFTFITDTLSLILYWWPTIFLGRNLIKTSADLRTLFVILVGAGAVYSFFLLIEMRVSPQLNNWIYGYHQSDFVQAIRDGHYRPMVFMRHGLNVALFIAVTGLAAVALGKVKGRVFGIKSRTLAVYLLVILVACHSLGALLYAAVGMPLLWFTKPRAQTRVAIALAILAFSYPAARAMGLVPVDDINAFVLEKFGEDRAGSLSLRFSEEGYLVERALERPVFGWGAGNRPFKHDPITGANQSVTDGLWAIVIGIGGIYGFVCIFGMLIYPVCRSRRALANVTLPRDKILVACLAFISAIYVVELIPNSSLDPYLTFLTAVLSGVVSRGLEPDPSALPAGAAYDPAPADEAGGVPRYGRQLVWGLRRWLARPRNA